MNNVELLGSVRNLIFLLVKYDFVLLVIKKVYVLVKYCGLRDIFIMIRE